MARKISKILVFLASRMRPFADGGSQMYTVQIKIIEGMPKVWLFKDGVTIAVGYSMKDIPLMGVMYRIPPTEVEALIHSANQQVEVRNAQMSAAYHAFCPAQQSN